MEENTVSAAALFKTLLWSVYPDGSGRGGVE